MNDLQKDKVNANGDLPPVSTVEEMRLKRLAYFTHEKSHTNEWKIDHPIHANVETCLNDAAHESDEVIKYADNHKPRTNNENDKMSGSYHSPASHPLYPSSTASFQAQDFSSQTHFVTPGPPSFSSQMPDQSRISNLDYSDDGPVPLRSKRIPISYSSANLSNSMGHLSLSESREGMTIFDKKPDIDDLGLSTHRPDSELSARGIQGELYIPSNQGSGKTTKQIFSHKTQEVLQRALGDEKMEELMNKVNNDIGELQQSRVQVESKGSTIMPLQRHSSIDGSWDKSRKDTVDNKMGRFDHPSQRRHSLNQDAAKDFRPLFAQNHDQISLPRSSRSSFSTQEIYRQAYGEGLIFERNCRESLGLNNNATNPIRKSGRFNETPTSSNDGQYSMNSARSSLIDYSGHMTPHHLTYQGYPHPFPYPSVSMPPPPIDPSHPPPNAGIPVSPQSSYNAGFPLYLQRPPYPGQGNSSSHNNHSHPLLHEPPNGYNHHYSTLCNPNQNHAVRQSGPTSPGIGIYNQPHPLSHNFSPPRFMGPPGMHSSFSMGQQQYQPYSHVFDQNHGPKNNFYPFSHPPPGYDQSGSSVKIPHPPSNPPSLQPKDDPPVNKSRPLPENRKVTLPTSQQATETSNEDEFKSYNLQRYFSSMELHTNDSDNLSTPVPQSSRSVEGDYYKTDTEDDKVTAITDVTGVTSASKAVGLTSRLAELGINLDHLKHLKLVDNGKKEMNESQDISFDAYAKSIRRCPECNTANKAYMDWCVECGEVLIGVDLSFPKGKKKQNVSNSNDSNKRNLNRSRSGNRGDERGRTKPGIGAVDVKHSDKRLLRRESPESGKGVSLTSSPARHKFDQEEMLELRDSGRASNGEVKDLCMDYPLKLNADEGDELVDGNIIDDVKDDVEVDDLEQEVIEVEEVYEEEGVEYVYEDVESNIFEQISDPILRDFIISYRNRQVENSNNHSQSVNDKGSVPLVSNNSNCDIIEEIIDVNSVNEDMDDDKKYGYPKNDDTNYISEEMSIKKSDEDVKKNQNKDGLEYRTKVKENHKSNTWVESPVSSVAKSDGKKKPKKKKKRPGHEAIDIEIFGYEESRQSRCSSKGSNIVPTLNLATSSDEEESEEEQEEENEEDDAQDLSPQPTSSSFTTMSVEPEIHHNSLKVSKDYKPSSQSLSKQPSPLPSRSVHASLHHGQWAGQSSSPVVSQSRTRPRSKDDNAMSSSATNYQRHWMRSSIAWSSYNPRELNTRSSNPNLSNRNVENQSSSRASVNRRKISETTGVTQNINSSINNNNNNNNPAMRQRPSSADYERRKPNFSQTGGTRPSSAKLKNEKMSSGDSTSSSPVPLPRRNNYVSPTISQKPRDKSPVVVKYKNSSKDSSLPHTLPTQVEEEESSGQVSDEKVVRKRSHDEESLRTLCPEFHRLPHGGEEATVDKMHAVAKSGYDRFHELTPRIQDGDVSLWQCLPDEVWLYILTFLPQHDLCHLMVVSKGFYRLANDESLWRYITVRPHLALTDASLACITNHHPISLAMVKCQGHGLSINALTDFFSQTQGRLKELNICGCSHGALVGSVVMETASKYCHALTHIDASFSNINDASFTSIVTHCDRLESVCVNGFQSMSDSALLTLVKKHGSSLRTLELYACFSLTATVLRNLGEYCHNLRRLCLGGCNKLSASTMITLSTSLARVEELDLRGCRNLKNECIRKIVRNCPRIQTLVLANCQQISNAALVEMGTYLKNTLKVVDVCGCNLVQDDGIISLVKNCDRLTSLDISSTGCMHSSIFAIATSNCSRWIETVKLSFLSGISEANLSNLIRHCPRLKLIHAFGCSSLRSLNRLREMRRDVTIEGDVEVPPMLLQ